MSVRSPRGYGVGCKRGRHVSITFDVDDAVFAQIQCIAEEREWTLNHVMAKLVPLGLEVYLQNTTLPHPFVLPGVIPSEEVQDHG